MDKKKLASLIDGREYLSEMSQELEEIAKDSGLVALFGYSDDNAEFRGAIDEEMGCYNGGVFFVSRDGISYDEEDGGKKIEAVWCDERTESAWTYKTDIPHETFTIYDCGDPYCIGIVFSVEDL